MKVIISFVLAVMTSAAANAQTVGDYFERERQKRMDLSIQLPLAEGGDWDGIFNVCQIYTSDDQQDFEKAYKWCSESAKSGHLVAQTYLGFLYMSGRGVQQSDIEAYKWFTASKYTLDAKDEALAVLEARMPDVDKAGVHLLLARLVEEKTRAQIPEEKQFYYRETRSEEAEFKAYQHYLKAAEFGNMEGVLRIASFLGNGIAIQTYDDKTSKLIDKVLLTVDRGAAAKWYRKAIEYNDVPIFRYAFANFLLQTREPIEAEIKEGIAQIDHILKEPDLSQQDRDRLERDKIFASHQLGVALSGEGTRDDEAVFWYLKTAREGYVDSMIQLLNMHLEGRNTVASAEEVYKWLRVLMLWYPDAEFNELDRVKGPLSDSAAAQAEAEAASWYESNKAVR